MWSSRKLYDTLDLHPQLWNTIPIISFYLSPSLSPPPPHLYLSPLFLSLTHTLSRARARALSLSSLALSLARAHTLSLSLSPSLAPPPPPHTHPSEAGRREQDRTVAGTGTHTKSGRRPKRCPHHHASPTFPPLIGKAEKKSLPIFFFLQLFVRRLSSAAVAVIED